MIILGINISHHTSNCIYENGKIKKLYNEERFNLEKIWAPDEKNFEILQSINQKSPLLLQTNLSIPKDFVSTNQIY